MSIKDLISQVRLHSVNPLVGEIDNFVSELCIQEIESALKDVELQTAMIAKFKVAAVDDDRRSAKNYKVPLDTIQAVDAVKEKVAELFRLKEGLCEHPEYIFYEEGGEFKRHFDAALSGSMSGSVAEGKPTSQRILTAVLYLNHDFTGGTTVFPRLDVEIQPYRGKLVFWQNTKPGSAGVHTHSMHQGCPVSKGNKRILSFWFRDHPWEAAGSE